MKRAPTYPAFALVDLFLVVSAYSAALGLRQLEPVVGDMSVFWDHLVRALPVIVGIHLLANVLAGAYGRFGKQSITQTTGALVAANVLSAGFNLVVTLFVGRSAFDIVIPLSVILVGAALSLALMVLARLLSASRQWDQPTA